MNCMSFIFCESVLVLLSQYFIYISCLFNFDTLGNGNHTQYWCLQRTLCLVHITDLMLNRHKTAFG
jgi:hypothetical protein